MSAIWVWNNKGAVLDGLKRYDEALAAYDQALKLGPTFVAAWTNKTITLRRRGRTTEAQEAERRAQALDV